jgi:hypothetical protein
MGLRKWSASNYEYGRRVLSSGLEGARSGREAFLQCKPVTSFLSESMHKVWRSAAIGACIGALGSVPGSRPLSTRRLLACSLMGSAIGFSVGIAWKNRRLTERIVGSALQSIGRVRDEHWLERHPIDYA